MSELCLLFELSIERFVLCYLQREQSIIFSQCFVILRQRFHPSIHNHHPPVYLINHELLGILLVLHMLEEEVCVLFCGVDFLILVGQMVHRCVKSLQGELVLLLLC